MTVKRLLATTAVLSLLLGSVPVTFDSADGTLSWQDAVAAKGGNGKGGGKGSHGDGSQVSSSHEENGDSLGKGHEDGHGGQVGDGHDTDNGGHEHGLGHEKGHGGQVEGGHGEDGHYHGLGENKDTSGVDVGGNQEEGQDSNGGTAESESDMGDVVEAAAAELDSTDSN
jgi:hypothetical protein